MKAGFFLPRHRPARTQLSTAAARDTSFDLTAFYLLMVAVVWAPWPLGSNRPWSTAVLGMLLWAGTALATASRLAGGRIRHSLPQGWPLPVAGIGGFACLVALQLMPGFGAQGKALSIDPFSTRRYLFTTLVYAGAWTLVLLTVTSRQRASRLLAAVLAAGVLQAVAAVLLYSSGASYRLWFEQFEYNGRATGTFVNPDHLAGYMELTLAAGMGWLFSQFGSEHSAKTQDWRGKSLHAMSFILSSKMLLRLLLAIPVMALVLTHSRMGNASFFLALLIMGLLVAARSRRLRRPALLIVLSMALVDLFIIGQWIGLDRVVQRIQDTAVTSASSETMALGNSSAAAPPQREESIQSRLEVPKLSLQLVAVKPWFGHGGGSYYTALPPFKHEGMPLYWDHAHNDYVQVASDTGLVGLSLWLVAGLATAWKAWQILSDRHDGLHHGVSIAALTALTCMGMHSMVDFNLHIPANAFTFTILLALVWTMPGEYTSDRGVAKTIWNSRSGVKDITTSYWSKRWRPRLLSAMAWSIAGWMSFEGQRMIRADWVSTEARQEVVRWVSGKTTPPDTHEWKAARKAIKYSLDLAPDSPEMQERMGDLYSVAGQANWVNEELRNDYFRRAAAHYESAVVLRPSEPGTWAMLAIVRQAVGASPASVQQAWTQARMLGPFEGHVQAMLMQVTLADWNNASPVMQEWAKALFDRASPVMQAEINSLAHSYGLVFKPDILPTAP